MSDIEYIELEPHKAHNIPYSPIVRVPLGDKTLIILSGMSALPLYHQHPHVREETMLPDDMEQQTHMVVDKLETLLESQDATLSDVVKLTKFLTDMREADIMHAVLTERFGDHKPASTMVAINNLSSHGARLELDAMAVISS